MEKNTLVISEYQAALIGALWGESHNLDKNAAELAAQTWFILTAQHARYRSGLEAHLERELGAVGAACPRTKNA